MWQNAFSGSDELKDENQLTVMALNWKVRSLSQSWADLMDQQSFYEWIGAWCYVLTLARRFSWALAGSVCNILLCFIMVINLIFVFSLWCMDWIREPLCEPNFWCNSYFCVALWFLLRGVSCWVLYCSLLSCLFQSCWALGSPRLRKHELTYMLLACVTSCLFLFLFMSGVGCALWVWHSLDFSFNFLEWRSIPLIFYTDRSKAVLLLWFLIILYWPFQGGTSVVVPYCYLFLLFVFILWFSYYVSDIFCKF